MGVITPVILIRITGSTLFPLFFRYYLLTRKNDKNITRITELEILKPNKSDIFQTGQGQSSQCN